MLFCFHLCSVRCKNILKDQNNIFLLRISNSTQLLIRVNGLARVIWHLHRLNFNVTYIFRSKCNKCSATWINDDYLPPNKVVNFLITTWELYAKNNRQSWQSIPGRYVAGDITEWIYQKVQTELFSLIIWMT